MAIFGNLAYHVHNFGITFPSNLIQHISFFFIFYSKEVLIVEMLPFRCSTESFDISCCLMSSKVRWPLAYHVLAVVGPHPKIPVNIYWNKNTKLHVPTNKSWSTRILVMRNSLLRNTANMQVWRQLLSLNMTRKVRENHILQFGAD